MERSSELIQMLERKPELKKYLFIRGFLLTNRLLDTDHFPFYSNWNIVKLGNFYAYTHNTLKLHYIKRTSKQGDCFFILLYLLKTFLIFRLNSLLFYLLVVLIVYLYLFVL